MPQTYKRIKTSNGRKRSKTTNVARSNIRRSVRYRRRVGKPKIQANIGHGFPKQMKVVHRYCDTIDVTGTAGALSFYRYSCNGLFDPDKTAVGHQPMYFDQMTAIYNHYHVIGSKIVIKVVPKNTTSNGTNAAILVNDDSVLGYSTMSSVRENYNCNFQFLNDASGNIKTMTAKWSAKKMFPGSVLANDSLKGDASSNPIENSEYHICVQAADVTSTAGIVCQVTVEYIAIWNELKEIGPS